MKVTSSRLFQSSLVLLFVLGFSFAASHGALCRCETFDLQGWIASLDQSDRTTVDGQDYLRIEIRANTFTPSTQGSASVAMDDQGGFVVAWDSRRQEGGTYGVYAQRFNPIGKRIGEELHINSTTRSTQWKPSLFFDQAGHSWFGWDSFGQDGDGFGCIARKFDRSFQPSSNEIVVNRSVWGSQDNLVFTPVGAEQIAAAWIGPRQGTAYRTAFLAAFNQAGETAGPVTQVENREGWQATMICLAPQPDEKLVAVWSALDPNRKPAGLFARLYDANGAPQSAVVKVNEICDIGSIEPSLAAFQDGGFVVTWMQSNGRSAYYDVMARCFDTRGAPEGESMLVHAHEGSLQNGAQAAAGRDGRFCVAWNLAGAKPDKTDIFGRFYRKEGSNLVQGDIFRINRHCAGNQALEICTGHESMAIGPQGQLAVAWAGTGDLDDRKGAHVTLLLPDLSGMKGDLDANQVVDNNDLQIFFELLTGRENDPIRYAAADLNRDGQVDEADLDCFSGINSTPFAEQLAAGKNRLAQFKESLAAARAVHAQKDTARQEALALARAQDPALVFQTDMAQPYEPPIRDTSTQLADRFGGDPEPLAWRVDYGFLGVTNTGWTPPDPHVAVGPDYLVAMTNGAIAFFDKQGNNTFQDEIEDSYGFWGSLGATWFVFDPEVIYDPHSQRFMAMACERTDSGGYGSSYFLLAVSDDADPNGSWHKYRLNVTSPGGGGDIDSPNIAVDKDVVYLTADFFNSGQKYLIYILDKAPLLTGAAPGITRNLLITGTQSHGIPVVYDDDAKAMFLIEHFEAPSNTTVRLHAITNPLGIPQRVTHSLTVPSYSPPEDPPQLGTSNRPETFDCRFWSCVYRNGSLWASHHQGSSRVMARWYEIDMGDWPASGTPTLVQSGDIGGGLSTRTFFNSISVDAFGNALMCYARSSPTEYISVSRACRAAGDTLGTMPDQEIVKTSSGAYSYTGRWGDYSAVGVDPMNDATFWYMHEYAANSSSWNTWIASKTVQPISLSIDKGTMSEATGGTVTFSLNNPSHANKKYLLLGTASGTSPGTPLPPNPGGVVLPINWDEVTRAIFRSLSTPFLTDFLGELDANGEATAVMTFPYLPNAAGVVLNFAYCQDGTYWDFASNYVTVLVEP